MKHQKGLAILWNHMINRCGMDENFSATIRPLRALIGRKASSATKSTSMPCLDTIFAHGCHIWIQPSTNGCLDCNLGQKIMSISLNWSMNEKVYLWKQLLKQNWRWELKSPWLLMVEENLNWTVDAYHQPTSLSQSHAWIFRPVAHLEDGYSQGEKPTGRNSTNPFQ